MIFKIIGLALITIFVFFTFNILTKYNKSYNYRNEDREKELEAKHYKLREIIKDEEEIKLVDDLISSKVKNEKFNRHYQAYKQGEYDGKKFDISDKIENEGEEELFIS